MFGAVSWPSYTKFSVNRNNIWILVQMLHFNNVVSICALWDDNEILRVYIIGKRTLWDICFWNGILISLNWGIEQYRWNVIFFYCSFYVFSIIKMPRSRKKKVFNWRNCFLSFSFQDATWGFVFRGNEWVNEWKFD